MRPPNFQASNNVIFRVTVYIAFAIPGTLQLFRYDNLESGPQYVREVCYTAVSFVENLVMFSS